MDLGRYDILWKELQERDSFSLVKEIRIDEEKCDGCAACINVCPCGGFEIKGGKAAVVNLDECLICMACELQCPNNAIKVIEWRCKGERSSWQ